jgi:hypothetical protein
MAAPLGHKRYGGRKKGTPNRKSVDLLTALDKKKFHVVEKLTEVFEVLEPSRKMDVLLALMTFLYPKRKAIDVKIDLDSEKWPSWPVDGRPPICEGDPLLSMDPGSVS